MGNMKKKIIKWVVGILLAPVILFFLLAALLYMPPVQSFAVRKATAYVSDATGMDVSVGRLRLTFFFDIDLHEVRVSDADKDVLLDVGRLKVDLSILSLFKGDVDVEALELERVSVNTKSMIDGVEVKGRLGRFLVNAHGIRTKEGLVTVNDVGLSDADIDVALKNDTTAQDTATSVVDWRIKLEHVALSDTRIRFSMPGDSMSVRAGIRSAVLQDGALDLAKTEYAARSFELQADSLLYDLSYEPASEGLDVNHLALRDVMIGVDSVLFDGNAMALSLAVRDVRMKEKSGLAVTALQGRLDMDSLSLHLPDMMLRTADSHLQLRADMDFDALNDHPQGKLMARLTGAVGKQDILLLAGGLPEQVVRAYPNSPLTLRLSADGNMEHLAVHTVEARLAKAFELKAKGDLYQLTDSLNMSAEVDMDLRTGNLDFLRPLIASGASADRIALPPMAMKGKVSMRGQRYDADLRLRESEGSVKLKAGADLAQMAYRAKLDVENLQLHHFLPKDSLYDLTLSAEAKGRGTDMFSRRTDLQAGAVLKELRYGEWNLSGVSADAYLHKGIGQVTLDSDNPLLDMTSRIDALLSRRNTDMTFSIDLRRIDLHALHLSKKPFKAGMCLHVDGETNLKDNHALHGGVTDILLTVGDSVFRPKDLVLSVLARTDTMYADVRAGDFLLKLDAQDGYEALMEKGQRFVDEAERQLLRRHIDQDSLKMLLPQMTLEVVSGKDNPVCNYLLTQGYAFSDFRFRLNTDPEVGLNGGGHLYALNMGGMTLDTLQMHIFQDSTGVKMDGRVRNGPKNRQFVFDARLNAYLHAQGGGVNLVYLDDKGRKGVDVGLRADALEEGLRVVFSQNAPVIAYRRFKINEDNYIFMGNDRRVEADVDMLADDGTGVKIYSTPNPEALQDISVALHHLNLGELTSVIPYAPAITGLLQGDIHLIQTEEHLSVMADMLADNMAYEGAPLGNIGLNAVYLPNEDGTHFIDSRISRNDEEIMALAGSYKSDDTGEVIDADLDMMSVPLSMANGFVADQIVTLSGTTDGCLTVKGSPQKPVMDGWMAFKDVRVVSPEYSLNLRLEDDTIRLDRSTLNFDRLNVYSTGKNPLVFDGTVNFSDFENILLDLRAHASSYELINARRTQKSSAYGKVYVDVSAGISGTLSDMNIRGRLGVLGNTDVTYILKDSPLTVEDRLNGLVTFVDFNDSTETDAEQKAQPMKINMVMLINIDQAAQVHCLLSADRSSYVDLEGGGELTFNYTPQGDMSLTGRYTVLSGEMKYSLPVIPLKTFKLTSGSYVDFNGPVMNPTLNIAATERVRATVTENDVPRTVSFDVGLAITRTLENMGLEFTLSAPEDMNIQNQLAAMSVEQRGRLAVSMLATGMYLAEGNSGTGGFSTTNAVNALLQSEISSLAGKALETIDLSVGMDQTTMADGNQRTDYSFRFAKRFWGNRVSIIVGGKVSTGEDVENTGQSLIDNISLEYRLDKSATRYVTLFYDKSYESLLEGEITEMGAGLVLRRKMTRLGELFIFKNRKTDEEQTVKETK